MKLPRWQAVARSVVFVDAERNQHYFRLRRKFDGSQALESARGRAGSPSFCVLARALVYRRRLQSRPSAKRGLENLLRAASEYFPQGLQPAAYCLHEDAEGAYICALPKEEASALAAGIGSVQAMIVGPDAPREADLLQAIERRHRIGPAADLLPQPAKIISSARLALAGALAGLAAAIGVSAWALWLTYPSAERLARKVAAAEAQAGEAAAQYESLDRMLAAQRALGDFGRGPVARAIEVATGILASIPAGHAVTSIELRNGELKITGVGAQPVAWLAPHGVPADAISTYRLQQTDRFAAQFPLPKDAAKGN